MMRAADAFAAMDGLPLLDAEGLAALSPILILAPHADDESLGCGGLIARLAPVAPPYVLVLTDGTGSHPNSRAYPASRLRRVREQEAHAAVAALGLPPGRIGFLGLPDTACPSAGPAFDAAITAIASLAMRLDARTILAAWQFDPHCDHEAGHHLAAAAAREAGLKHLAYPVWGLTLPMDTPLPLAGITGHRLDVAAELPVKRRAIAAHRSQHGGLITDDPTGFTLPRSFLALFDRRHEILLEP